MGLDKVDGAEILAIIAGMTALVGVWLDQRARWSSIMDSLERHLRRSACDHECRQGRTCRCERVR